MRQWTIDAFADQPFRGNPACVVEPFAAWPSDTWMQALAAENNQAETAFLRITDDPARFDLRWFTPGQEVPLCGHATLAAGHALMTELGVQTDAVSFQTLSGPLRVRRAEGGYEMDFPALPCERIATPPGLAEALGVTPIETWTGFILLAILDGEAAVRAAKPNLAALMDVPSEAGLGPGNVAITALADADSPYDVVSRFFAPGAGIAEDPATGALHCGLAPLFADRLGCDRLRFHQAYPGRGADLICERRGDRVALRGRAVTVLDGRLRLDPG